MKKNNSTPLKSFLLLRFIGVLALTGLFNTQAHGQKVFSEKPSLVTPSYLESKDELKDYILDTGDVLNIKFINTPELSGFFRINELGEIYLNRLKESYVRGLTIKELKLILEKRYAEFLNNPKLLIRIAEFKPIRVLIKGEVRAPRLIRFPSYQSNSIATRIDTQLQNKLIFDSEINQIKSSPKSNSLQSPVNRISQTNLTNSIKRFNDFSTTLSNAIKEAGGLTSYSDIYNIEIVRDIPIGRGGGKKRTIVNLDSYIKYADPTNDIRLFDGDAIFIPKLQKKDPSIIANSILAGLSPRFIKVTVSGRIENPGDVRIPIEGALSDVMNLTGPKKPLSGDVYLIRYNRNGTLLRKSINYSSSALPGSLENPYLISGDLVTVKNSVIGRVSETVKLISEPIVSIFAYEALLKRF
tara:strand:+ start:541 stop:1776 length:1236 start_codon:yes stop_codon:yes gene_type:complete